MSENKAGKPKEVEHGKRRFRRAQGPSTGEGRDKTKSSGSWSRDNKAAGDTAVTARDDGSDLESLCVICTDKLDKVSLTPCNHKTCYKCSFRQIALYKKRMCLVCRSELKEVIFTEDILSLASHDNYTEFLKNNTSFVTDEEYDLIKFTSEDILKATKQLLHFTCQVCDNGDDHDFGSFRKLNEHLKDHHNRRICMICAEHRHSFPSELRLFSAKQLHNHQTRGNDAVGFKGHPLCGFCSGRRFFSDDELYLHMREKHERCHICDKIDPTKPQYFSNYEDLFQHFKTSHYVCTVPSCLEMKFVVFRDELELQAHILQEHGNIIRGKPKFFQSELSTFISAPSRVIQESTNTSTLHGTLDSLSSRSGANETPIVKKMRLEERAKYYLGSDVSRFQTFLKINEDFSSGKISGNELLTSYKSLFTSEQSDIYLLVLNFAETFHTNSKKYKELKAIYEAHEERVKRQLTNTDLPSLARDPTYSTPIVAGQWGASSSVARNPLRSLPTLPTKSSNHDPFANPYGTHVSKTTTKMAKVKPVTVTKLAQKPKARSGFQTSVNLSTSKVSPSSAAAILASAPSPPEVSAPSSLSFSRPEEDGPQRTKVITQVNINRDKKLKNVLESLNLPSLPTQKPKIPPVKKTVLPDPNKWGKTTAATTTGNGSQGSNLANQLDGLDIGNSTSGKRKNKQQKQLLFHIGI